MQEMSSEEETPPAPAIDAPKERRYDKFRKMGAEDFKGTTNPLEAERWLQRTERIFGMMYYTPEEKLDYAVSLLQDDAYDWWMTVPHSQTRPWVLGYDDFLQVKIHDPMMCKPLWAYVLYTNKRRFYVGLSK